MAATIIAKQSLNGIEILKTDTSPVSGGGLAAPIGSQANAGDGTGLAYKVGAADTDWISLSGNITVASTVTPASHTGDTNETILGTPLTIPAKTFIANDEMVIRLSGNTINVGSGIKTYKIYLNTTPDLTGAPIQINQLFTLAAATVGVRFVRYYDIETTNFIKANIVGSTNLSTDYTNNGAFTTYTPDLTVTQYLIATGTLASGADTINLQSLRILRNRP